MNPLTSPFQSAIYKPNKPAKPAMPVGGKYVGASSPVPSQGIMSQARHYAGMDPSPAPQPPGLMEVIAGTNSFRGRPSDSTSAQTPAPAPVSPASPNLRYPIKDFAQVGYGQNAATDSLSKGADIQPRTNPVNPNLGFPIKDFAQVGYGQNAATDSLSKGVDIQAWEPRVTGSPAANPMQGINQYGLGNFGQPMQDINQYGFGGLAAAVTGPVKRSAISEYGQLPQEFKDRAAARTIAGTNVGVTDEDMVNAYNRKYATGESTLGADNERVFRGSEAPRVPTAPRPAAQAQGRPQVQGVVPGQSPLAVALLPEQGRNETRPTADALTPQGSEQITQDFMNGAINSPEAQAYRATDAKIEENRAKSRQIEAQWAQNADVSGSNVQPGVDKGLFDKLTGLGLRGDQIAQRELRNTGIGGVSRGGRYSGGSTAYAGGAFSEYDTPRPSTFDAGRRDAAIAAIKNGTIGPAKNSIDIDPTRNMNSDQLERFAANSNKYADRRQNALAMRIEQAGQRQQAQAEAQQAYASNPLNNPMLADFVMNNPVAGAAIVNSVMNNQSEMQRANLEAGLRQAELGQRGTEFQTTTGLKTKELEANIKTAADNLALAKEADKRAGQTAESQAILNAAEAAYRNAQAGELKTKSETVANLATPEALARQTRIDIVRPEVEAGVKTSEEAEQFINGTTPAPIAGSGPIPVSQAAVQLPREAKAVQSLFPETPVADMSWRDMTGSLLGRIDTASAPSDEDLAKIQRYAQTRSRNEPGFDGELGFMDRLRSGVSVTGAAGKQADKDSALMKLLLGTERVTAAKVKELTKRK